MSDNDQVLHDIRNTLYGEMNLSNAQYSQTDSSEMPTGQVHEVDTSEVVGQGYPYETPVLLAGFSDRND